jgi:multimeric flavodoxin WrbA
MKIVSISSIYNYNTTDTLQHFWDRIIARWPEEGDIAARLQGEGISASRERELSLLVSKPVCYQ